MNALVLPLLLACATDPAPAPASAAAEPRPAAEAGPLMKEAIERGEVASFTIDGDTVHVNNRLCAVSHNPLKPGHLDEFTSTVEYHGDDPRFRGKKLVFNQCCPMCAKKFAVMWQRDPESILRFHGLEPAG